MLHVWMRTSGIFCLHSITVVQATNKTTLNSTLSYLAYALGSSGQGSACACLV